MQPNEENQQEMNYQPQPAAGNVPVNAAPLPTNQPMPDQSSEGPAPTGLQAPPQQEEAEKTVMRWQASEFIDHQKEGGWFLMLALITGVVCTGVYFITDGDILSTMVIGVAAIAFGVFANKKPRTLTYTLLPTSIKIGEKSYSYDEFRTFSVVSDGGLNSIILQPTKRFMPPLTVYFAVEDGEQIFDTLAVHIPHEEKTTDMVERFMKRIRF